MSARYHDPQVQLEPETRRLRLHCRVQNLSRDLWRKGDLSLGSQIYDPDTGIFISEGEWAPLADDLAPGQAGDFDLHVDLPPEPGRYRVYVSPIQEATGWHHQRGWPFLLVDLSVENHRAQLVETRVTTAAGLRRRSWRRALAKALTWPLLTMWRNGGLIRSMVRRDILARYRGSFGDVLWTVLNPLLLMSTYFFVFGVVLNARFGADPSRAGFALYFLAGMLPWLAFSEAAGRAPNVVLEHRNFVKKLVFPIETLPVTQTVAALVTEAFALVVFLAALLLARGAIPLTVLWLPVLLIPQLLFTLGVCWFLAATGAFVRDLGQVIGFLLTLWFFLTPICYPDTSLPQAAVAILSKNPLFVLVRAYRAIFLETRVPDFAPLWKLTVVAVVVFILGHAWFYKLRRSFADGV